MAKCIRCGDDTLSSLKICSSCLCKWTDMRTIVLNTLESKYGKLSPINHQLFIKETKRLEKIWRKDNLQFTIEIEKLNTCMEK